MPSQSSSTRRAGAVHEAPADSPPPSRAPDVQEALARVAHGLALTIGLPGRPRTRARKIDVAPADLGGLRVGLEPLAVDARRTGRAGARARTAGTPVVSAAARAPVAVAVEGSPPRALCGAPVTIEARLVLQGIGEPLSADEAQIVPDARGLGFDVLAAPRFVEAGARSHIDARTRRIALQARVRASATVAGVRHETLEIPVPSESVELSLLPVELPTLLVLFRHPRVAAPPAPTRASAERGRALVLVPPGSAVPERPGRPGDILPDALIALARTLERLPALGPAMDRLLLAAELLAPADLVVTVRHAPQSDLDRIGTVDPGEPGSDPEAGNRVGSLMLLGRPGTVADLFCARDLRPAEGHVRVALDADGPLPVALAVLESLPGARAITSAGVTVLVERASRGSSEGGGCALAGAIRSVRLAEPGRATAAGPP